MADGDRPTIKRSRAPLSGVLAVPQSVAAPQNPALPSQANESSTPTAHGTFQPNYFFETPAGQTTVFCNEIPAIPGISDEDSYLFVSRNRDDAEGYRAFVVPKSDPSKQHEIPMTDAVLDTDKKEFRAKLAGGHDYTWSPLGAMLDGLKIAKFERNSVKAHNLINEPIPMGLGSDDNSCWGSGWDGRSWYFVMKDLHTGVIQEFTQTPGTDRGTLRVIQGDIVTKTRDDDTDRGGDWLHKVHAFAFNGEWDRAPKSVAENVTLPADMAARFGADEAFYVSVGCANLWPKEQQLPSLLRAGSEVRNPKPHPRKTPSARRDGAAP